MSRYKLSMIDHNEFETRKDEILKLSLANSDLRRGPHYKKSLRRDCHDGEKVLSNVEN